jgi:hypothetical protein
LPSTAVGCWHEAAEVKRFVAVGLVGLAAMAAAVWGSQAQPIDIGTLCTLEQGGAAVVCGYVDHALVNGAVFGVLAALLGLVVEASRQRVSARRSTQSHLDSRSRNRR